MQVGRRSTVRISISTTPAPVAVQHLPHLCFTSPSHCSIHFVFRTQKFERWVMINQELYLLETAAGLEFEALL